MEREETNDEIEALHEDETAVDEDKTETKKKDEDEDDVTW